MTGISAPSSPYTAPEAPLGAQPSGPRPSSVGEKFMAAGIHFLLSLLATGTLGLLMWTKLYPPPFFWIDGGWSVLRILLLADLVLGPLLTFVVYNRAKREWKRDLAIVALVQIVAFAYGTYTMARYRPVFAVYIDRGFFAVTWPKVEMATRDLAKPRALRGDDVAPTYVVVDMPTDRAQQSAIMRQANPDGTSALPGMGDRYLAFDGDLRKRILDNSADIEVLARGDADIAKELARIRAEHPGPLSNYSFQPLVGRDLECMLVFEKASGKMVDCMK